MIRGLLRKTLSETWAQIALFSVGLFLVSSLLTLLLPQLEKGFNQVISSFPFVRDFVQALLGQSLRGQFNVQNLQAIIWVHPTILALLWAQEIILCTRVPAGEIDRGTIDILLSWPVSRRKLFAVESMVWMATGVVLCVAMLLGHTAARLFAAPTNPAPITRVLIVLFNLYCMYLAVGGIAFAVSATSSHRGRAMGVVFAILLTSFLLNFVVQFWPAIVDLAPLSVLYYYRPAEILANGQIPAFNVAVLLCVALIGWISGFEVFARRSICTV
jgi:ABC-2 type transport system permease protein